MKNAFLSLAVALPLLAQGHLSAQPVPHHFSGLAVLADKTVRLSLDGAVSNRFQALFDIYPVEVSPNLSDWMPLATLVRTNANTNGLQLADSGAVGQEQRFYRTPTNSFISPFWKATGPYSVGTLDRVLSDPSRTNRYGVKTNSAFYASFWYPAQLKAGALPDRLVDAELGKALVAAWSSGISGFSVLTNSYLDARLDSQVATNQTAYPVVIYSCGGGSMRKDNSGLAVELASDGYVVVSADHEDNGLVRVPGGRLVSGNLPADSVPTYQSRYQDMEVILAGLVTMNASDPVLGGHLDLERIGVVGWSTGGVNAAQLCLEEARIKVGVLLDPGLISYVPNLLKMGIQTPFLVITGELSDGRQLFDKATGPAYWLHITGSFHMSMGDPLLYSGAAKDRRITQVLRAYVLSAFDRFLLNSDDHLLDGPSPLYPEVTKILAK